MYLSVFKNVVHIFNNFEEDLSLVPKNKSCHLCFRNKIPAFDVYMFYYSDQICDFEHLNMVREINFN